MIVLMLSWQFRLGHWPSLTVVRERLQVAFASAEMGDQMNRIRQQPEFNVVCRAGTNLTGVAVCA